MTTDPVDKLLYTPREAAQALGVSRSTLYVLLSSGALPSVRIPHVGFHDLRRATPPYWYAPARTSRRRRPAWAVQVLG
jgi:excisionase family DNA binding protein